MFRDFAQSHHLSRPTTFNGTLLPAGSTIQADSDGAIFGTISQPTVIAGIPCAAGEINLNPTFTYCVLGRNFIFHGFPQAAGTHIQVRGAAGEGDSRILEQGTIAAPTLLFDTLYPAGTLMAFEATSPSASAHLPAATGIQPICLAPGASVQIQGATLFGPYRIDYTGTTIQLTPTCNYLFSPAPVARATHGHGMSRGTPFTHATYDTQTAQWTNVDNTFTPDPE